MTPVDCLCLLYISVSVDYSTVISEVTFQPGETRITVPVPIIDDDIFEDVEIFRAHLTTTDDNVNIGDSMATVSIADNDGEAYIILTCTCTVISLCMVCTVICDHVRGNQA